jgi:UDP-2-acetamido-2-deoxy-ribo-hexuluronate aminotransferase
VGVNSRLDTLQAGVLLAKLPAFDSELKSRQEVSARYNHLLNGIDELVFPYIESHNMSAFAQYTISVPNRDLFVAKLKKSGVPTAVHYPEPLNKQPAVADAQAQLPFGDRAAQMVLSLPMHPYLTEKDQVLVVETLISSN